MRNSNYIGRVHSVDTYSTLDGFGIRSVVFMQGCDLRCIYCHNPDTWNRLLGQEMSSSDIVNKLKNYISYYGKNGGVTFGGGEPLLQVEFVLDCVTRLNKLGVKCAIETAGSVKLDDNIKTLLKKLDFVICDLKFANNSDYVKYTCSPIDNTLEFLNYLNEQNIPVWIRTVVVPNINDCEEKIAKYRQIIDKFNNVIRYELLPLSKLGFTKYEKLNICNRLKNVEDLDMNKFQTLQQKFEINRSKRK